MIARTPQPPYYAVIFTSLRSEQEQGYADAAARMLELAARQDGFLGVESARGADGLGITVSYWRDEAAIRHWREEGEHRIAQRRGRQDWYSGFQVRVCRVERAYGFER
ncbi:antibiotic biosynthesis monooxygenase [Pseudomonas sp. ATCC 13867]|uniref:antibiotic biosynthesis monooxygenase family protein n=1 Tax=Pseudomonas sp. ATCC 13867 TaxID=1294143 RepID=UPI0002C4F326|nr:antibiotic biosynthesis monooxygenase [Pseudomonas sp. ATCC 13867]AGI23891.1 antibiotic biosynthesis monooxygenase [Pseudomonas sp. ATCC 13867]RFQ38296.1 antibiotic biosynthesis monooxygenase [Pseudomonas sp. ATCC 13867]